MREKGQSQERELKIARDEFLEINREYERRSKVFEDLSAQKSSGEDELRRLERETLNKRRNIQQMLEKSNQYNDDLDDLKLRQKKQKFTPEEVNKEYKNIKEKESNLNGSLKVLRSDCEAKEGRVNKLEGEIDIVNKTIRSHQEEVHQREEEELFFSKKIEALESLLMEKRKREAYSKKEKKRNNQN